MEQVRKDRTKQKDEIIIDVKEFDQWRIEEIGDVLKRAPSN